MMTAVAPPLTAITMVTDVDNLLASVLPGVSARLEKFWYSVETVDFIEGGFWYSVETVDFIEDGLDA